MSVQESSNDVRVLIDRDREGSFEDSKGKTAQATSPNEIDVAVPTVNRFQELGTFWLEQPSLNMAEINRDIKRALVGAIRR